MGPLCQPVLLGRRAGPALTQPLLSTELQGAPKQQAARPCRVHARSLPLHAGLSLSLSGSAELSDFEPLSLSLHLSPPLFASISASVSLWVSLPPSLCLSPSFAGGCERLSGVALVKGLLWAFLSCCCPSKPCGHDCPPVHLCPGDPRASPEQNPAVDDCGPGVKISLQGSPDTPENSAEATGTHRRARGSMHTPWASRPLCPVTCRGGRCVGPEGTGRGQVMQRKGQGDSLEPHGVQGLSFHSTAFLPPELKTVNEV